MPKLTYVDAEEHPMTVEAQDGDTVMTAAVRHGVPGILGECGGNASCATCHVWVRPEWRAAVGAPALGGDEDDLLDLGVQERRESSRLGCQIPVTEEMDGATFDVPPS